MALSVSPSWDVLAGDDGGMTRSKLFGRMERVVGQPPKFIFRIERHGADQLLQADDEFLKDLAAMDNQDVGSSQPPDPVMTVRASVTDYVSRGQGQTIQE